MSDDSGLDPYESLVNRLSSDPRFMGALVNQMETSRMPSLIAQNLYQLTQQGSLPAPLKSAAVENSHTEEKGLTFALCIVLTVVISMLVVNSWQRTPTTMPAIATEPKKAAPAKPVKVNPANEAAGDVGSWQW